MTMGKLVIGTNDLQTRFPEIAAEWDVVRNGNLSPSDISYGSERRIWWKCASGHEWIASVNSRTSTLVGCPYCSGRIAITGANDLRTLFPDISKEWHPTLNGELTPDKIKPGSNKKVWWLCSKNHSYQSTVSNRTGNHRGCPYCCGSKVLEGYNDLKTWCLSNHRTDLLEEWDYSKNLVLPTQVTPHTDKKVWWKCSLGHEWNAIIGSRTSDKRPTGCPFCSNPPKKILVGFNDFESWCKNNGRLYLLDEWNTERNSIGPRDVTYGSGKRIWWKCNKGHEWCVSTGSRIGGTGCPICSRKQTSFPEQALAYYISKSFNIVQRYKSQGYELDVYLPEYKIGVEYDGMFYHTEEIKDREIEKNHFFEESNITLIRVKEDKYKSGVEGHTIFFIPKGKSYLNDSFNNMLSDLFNLLEKLTKIQADRDFDVIRDELKIREKYATFLKAGSFASVYPELVQEWDIDKNEGMNPDSFSANANTKVWWKCSKGHSWQALITSRGRGLGCPYCAGQRTLIGMNDLETWSRENNPGLLDEWNYKKNTESPSSFQKTSAKKVWWICSEGHEWEASIANRVHGTGCPVCNKCDVQMRGKISLSEWCRSNKQEHLLREWHYSRNGLITPDTVTRGSHKIVWWQCSNGHEWEAQIKSRTYNHGCPYCSKTNKKPLEGKNDLVTWCKDNGKQYILDEWDYESNGGLMPRDFTYGSHKRISWKCEKGHKWSAIIKERTKFKGNMCPLCRENSRE